MAYQVWNAGDRLYAGSLNNNFNYVNGLRYVTTNMEIPTSGTNGYIGSYLFNGGGSEFLGNSTILHMDMFNDNIGGSITFGISGNNYLFSGAKIKMGNTEWINSKLWVGSSTLIPSVTIRTFSQNDGGTQTQDFLGTNGSPYNINNPFCLMWYIQNFTNTGSITYKIYNSPN